MESDFVEYYQNGMGGRRLDELKKNEKEI